MAVDVTYQTGSQTAVISTEHTLGTADDTTVGVYQLFVDVANMARGDTLELRAYEKARAADTQRVIQTWTLYNEQTDDVFASPSFLLGAGFKWTLTQTAGTGRVFPWSIRQAA